MDWVAVEDQLGEFSSCEFSDDELCELALSADPNVVVDPGAVPWRYDAADAIDLPSWYMPPAVAFRRGKGTRIVVVAIIFGFLLIDACGLCITSGFLSLA